LGYWGVLDPRYRPRATVSGAFYDGRVSKQSITRKLAKNSKRLTSLRAELGTIDEQARHLRDDAEDMALRAIVAGNTGVSRDARRAQEHAEAHRKNRDRVVVEIADLERRQDQLLDELSAAR
jgi:ABC-type phosphate transport system auxiliary subunit